MYLKEHEMESNITYSMGAETVKKKKDVTQNKQLIFKNMLKYETKSTVYFPKPTDTDAKQTITDAKPTVLL